MKTDDLNPETDPPMNRSNAIEVVLSLMPVILGEKLYAQTSPDFKRQVIDGSQFVESLQTGSCMFTKSEMEAINNFVNPTDCEKLGNIIDALQNAFHELCPIL